MDKPLLTVKPRPPINTSIDQGEITANTAQITWTPGNDGGETQWFYVNYREVETTVDFDPKTQSDRIDDISEYVLQGLRPYTMYEIQVYAENANGISKTVTRTVTTLREFMFACFINFEISLPKNGKS